jgi:hypothetical protein
VSRGELVDEIANELDTWPGVSIERRADGGAIALYDRLELGALDRDRGVVEHGHAEPADPPGASDVVSHSVQGPSDVTAALALFDRRYRELRGEEDPYSSEDPA